MNREALKNLTSRRSCRKYGPGEVSEEALGDVLRAGMFAPSGGGHQSPRFVVVKTPAVREQLRKMNATVMGDAQADPYYGAPALILVFADRQRTTGFEDACLALGNMMNAAAALDLGSCWIHREKEMFDSAEGQDLMRGWKLDPARYAGVGACILGQPAEPAAPPPPRIEDYVRTV